MGYTEENTMVTAKLKSNMVLITDEFAAKKILRLGNKKYSNNFNYN